jgi:glycosyltransferase involved in cell wall biosynthesis
MVDEDFVLNKAYGTRVGFVLSPDDWLGGRNYLRNLFAALCTLPDNPITPVIFTGNRQDNASADFPQIEVVRTSVLDRKSAAWYAQKLIARAIGRDLVLQRLLEKHGVSVLSHSFHLEGKLAVKTLGWIPDFQHIHLPKFFSLDESRLRDRVFMQLSVACTGVIVSSECARADFCAFSPKYAPKAELLRFVASPVALSHAPALDQLRRQYDFDGPYFLLPNQFWAHKNHRVVITALQILKRREQPLLVLATGSSVDLRNPSFFPSLMQYAAECDVLDCFRVLGKIPYDHLVGLMQHATAFINPSSFEGWSTSVEEAKSMGKQILLSDIPVHREQAPERGFYFPAEDPEALADSMQAAYDGYDTKHDIALQDAARARFPERQQKFAGAYWDIIKRLSENRDPAK